MRRLLGLLLGLVVRAWVWTFRVRVVAPANLADFPPSVFAFWHGRQMPLFSLRPGRRAVALVSRSRDGELQAGLLAAAGLGSVRGSSSRGGAVALGAVVRRLARVGEHALFAVDGPRGPAFRAKPGAAKAAALAHAPLVPLGSGAAWTFRLARAWDDFLVVLPFSRVVVVVGEPVDPATALADPRVLEAAIAGACERARDAVVAWGCA